MKLGRLWVFVDSEELKMNENILTRRQFITAASAGSLAAVASRTIPAYGNISKKAGKLAILGGRPVRTKSFPGWPIWDRNADEKLLLSVLRSGVWSRNKVVAEEQPHQLGSNCLPKNLQRLIIKR